MSLLEQLCKKKSCLKTVTTVVTTADGRQFLESTTGCVQQEMTQKQFGFVVDTKPDNIPAEIVNHLYLGSQDCCELNVLQKFDINFVLSVGIEAPCTHPLVNYKFVKCLDLPETNIISIIENECVEFIKTSIDGRKNVLVHCNAGVSRSPAVVIGFLMLTQTKTFGEAYEIVKSKRPCIKPNIGFETQLKLFKKC